MGNWKRWNRKISKCVAAQKGNTSGVAPGSLGPEDKCFKKKKRTISSLGRILLSKWARVRKKH